MNTRFISTSRWLSILAFSAPLALVGCQTTTSNEVAPANQSGAKTQGDMPQMKLPPGWTQADMQACMAAATPGPMQQKLARGVGHWTGKCTQWMAPDTEPTTSECTATISSMMDGRYTKVEFAGEMPGMGPFHGLGFYGYDNVAQKPVAAWMDNCATGIANGDGQLSDNGDTLTWTYHMMCPIQKKMTSMREVEHYKSDNSLTLDMYGIEPKSGKEFHMMHIEMTRASS